ncbi:MAG: DUF3293 domain-containing protein [Pseudomonadota bacterium]
MTPELRDAFRNTRYQLYLPAGTVALAVDQYCAALGEWMRANSCTCAAWMTAFNPASQLCETTANTAAQQQLESRLATAYTLAQGTAIDPSGHWPPEPSVLVAGMSCAVAMRITRELGQLAFLWCDADAIPRLLETAQVSR